MGAGGLVRRPIRNQQVVGSNPTGGSRKSSKHKALKVHFDGHSVDLLRIVREMSEFVNVRVCQGATTPSPRLLG
jgi:hypothetical protein